MFSVAKPGLYEYQLEAELEYCFLSHGARTPAYPSIVGGGSNACVLHYIQNDDVLRKGDLVTSQRSEIQLLNGKLDQALTRLKSASI